VSQIEKRKHKRIALKSDLEGTLALRVAGRHYPVAMVKDVSNYGVNIVVAEDFPERTRVTIEFADANLRLDVHGIVAWRAPGKSGRADGVDFDCFILGVELFSPTLLTAVLGAA
jgi:hypothetical protein